MTCPRVYPSAQWEMGKAPVPQASVDRVVRYQLWVDGWTTTFSCDIWLSGSCVVHVICLLYLNTCFTSHNVHCKKKKKKVFSLPSAAARSWASKSTSPTWFWQKKPRSRILWAVRLSRGGSPHFCCPLPFSCEITEVKQRYVALLEHNYFVRLQTIAKKKPKFISGMLAR